ncbi:response regulator transcription factor [Synechococcus sp. RSCCF101]|uniref:response regulator transcription factor n=1 Tax=Synechococcus sp. RSCCF101 TaxID=2511069 RepID=UPI00351A2946
MTLVAPSPVSTARLLVVEDDDSIRETICEALSLDGFEVSGCPDGITALRQLEGRQDSGAVDLVVLDLMLPGLGGLDLCRRLRRANNTTPILVVSARDSETDRVLGLEVGADDYLVKPFGLRELVARCRALLRRSQRQPDPGQPPPVLRHESLCLYVEECRVSRDGRDLKLSPKEYRILELFMRHPRRVWSRDQLLERVWGLDFIGDTKTVDVHMRWLREKVEDDPSNPRHIRTVRGFGYRFG